MPHRLLHAELYLSVNYRELLYGVGGWPSLHCTVPAEGALRFLQEPAPSLPKGWGDAASATFVRSIPSVVHAVAVPPPRLRSGQALRKVREGRGARICGGFCSLKAGPPADKDGAPGLLGFTSWAATPAAQDLRGGSTQRVGRSVHRYVR